MRFFVVHFFFIFQDSVWLVKKSWCVHCCSIHRFYWPSDRCRRGFALWWFFVRKKLSSQIGSFHWLLVLATECFLSFDIFEIHSDNFMGCYYLLGLLTVHGSTKFLNLVLCFWNMSFFVFIPDAIFCSTIFFSYFRTLCGWLSHFDAFIIVPFIRYIAFVVVAEANLRCGDSLSEKVFVTVLAVFLSFWSWLPHIPWVFINLKDSAAFLGLIMHCLFVIGTWKRLVFDFSFFLWNHVILCVYQWCGFSRYKWFHFWSVSGWYYIFDVLIFIPLFNSTVVVVVALANLRWTVFVSIKLSQIGSFP